MQVWDRQIESIGMANGMGFDTSYPLLVTHFFQHVHTSWSLNTWFYANHFHSYHHGLCAGWFLLTWNIQKRRNLNWEEDSIDWSVRKSVRYFLKYCLMWDGLVHYEQCQPWPFSLEMCIKASWQSHEETISKQPPSLFTSRFLPWVLVLTCLGMDYGL